MCNIFEEISQLNRERLLSFKDFKIISFLLGERIYNDDNLFDYQISNNDTINIHLIEIYQIGAIFL